jgi:hypothetical protein
MDQSLLIKIVLLSSIVLLVLLLLKQNMKNKEKFMMGSPINPEIDTGVCPGGVQGAGMDQSIAQYQKIDYVAPKAPRNCYPQDQLTPQDLLPGAGSSASAWAQANPMGQGDMENVNFLTAGYHIGQNTVGQTKRNANLSIRTEIPNPRVAVSPWNQSTIEPDLNRKPLDSVLC